MSCVSLCGSVGPRAAPIGAPFRTLEIRIVTLPAVHRTAAQRDEELLYFRGERRGRGRYPAGRREDLFGRAGGLSDGVVHGRDIAGERLRSLRSHLYIAGNLPRRRALLFH